MDTDGCLYAIDYVNADPDMNPRSYYSNGAHRTCHARELVQRASGRMAHRHG